jgi:ABC-type multidrug transport system ATPase subunit
MLRLGADVTTAKREAIVRDSIKLLQMEHIKDSIVGSVEKRGISGGQRKRVNIGIEMVADPVVLFLDEPTSGLDSTSSEVVLGALKDMTGLGLTVITVIHQPRFSIFTRFDHVLLLGRGGITVYSGPSVLAEPYFDRIGFKCPRGENPADFFMDVISGQVEKKDGKGNTEAFVSPDLFKFWKDTTLGANDQPFHNAGGAIFAELQQNIEAHTMGEDETKQAFTPAEIEMVLQLFERLDKNFSPQVDGLTPHELRTMVEILKKVENDDQFRKILRLDDLQIRKFSTDGLSSERRRDEQRDHTKSPSMKDVLDRSGMPIEEVDHAQQLEDAKGKGWFAKAAYAVSNFRLWNETKTGANKHTVETFRKDKTHMIVQWLLKQGGGDEQLRRMTLSTMTGAEQIVTRVQFENFLMTKRITPAERIGLLREMYGDNDEAVAKLTQSSVASGDVAASTLSIRSTPSFFTQLLVFMRIAIVKLGRNQSSIFLDLVQIIMAAAIMGLVNGTQEGSIGELPTEMLLMVLFFGCLSVVGSLRTFGANQLIFWRESAAGVNTVSFFVANCCVDLLLLFFKPVFYHLIYYATTLPETSQLFFAASLVCVSWACSGYGCVVVVVALCVSWACSGYGCVVVVVLCVSWACSGYGCVAPPLLRLAHPPQLSRCCR